MRECGDAVIILTAALLLPTRDLRAHSLGVQGSGLVANPNTTLNLSEFACLLAGITADVQ